MTGIAIAPQAPRPGESGHGHRDRAQRLAAADRQVPRPAPPRGRRPEARPGADGRPGRRRDGDRRVPARASCPRGSGAGTSRRRPAMNCRSTIAASWPSRSRPRRGCCWWTATRAGPRTSRRPTSSRPRCGSRRRASAMPSRRSIRGRSMLVGGDGLPDLEKTEAVVLANVDDLGASDAQRLGEFVERGGGLLVFTGDRVAAGAARDARGGRPGRGRRSSGPRTATELPWRLERWETQHPVFQPFADPEHGDLRRPVVHAITRIKPGPGSPGAGVGSAAASRRCWSGPRDVARSSGSPRRATAPGATGRAAGCTCRWSIR